MSAKEAAQLAAPLYASKEEKRLARRRAKEAAALEKHRAKMRREVGGTRRGGGQIVQHFDDEPCGFEIHSEAMPRCEAKRRGVQCPERALPGSTPPRCKCHGGLSLVKQIPEPHFGYLPKSDLFLHLDCPNRKENQVAPMVTQSSHFEDFLLQCEGCKQRWSYEFIDRRAKNVGVNTIDPPLYEVR